MASHSSTNTAQPCLNSVIGEKLVYLRWHGLWLLYVENKQQMLKPKQVLENKKVRKGRADADVEILSHPKYADSWYADMLIHFFEEEKLLQ